FLLVFLRQPVSLVWVFLAWVLSKLVSVGLLLPLTKRLIAVRFSFDKKLFIKIVKESLPMGALLILFSAYDRAVDTFMIRYFLGSTQVAFYGLSYKVYGHLVLPAYFLVNSLFPFLSKGKKGTGKIGLGLMGLGLVFLLPLVMTLAPLVIGILAGSSFSASVLVLRILALALVFSWLNHLTGFSLVAKNKQMVSLKIGALAMGFNLVLNYLLIPRFGIVSAAWVTVATEALVFGLSSLALTVFKD
ncbi:MAG: polysaccharide biosynthesis C-terminal domain-containing protein, partial [Patescibacteria group bacterium]